MLHPPREPRPRPRAPPHRTRPRSRARPAPPRSCPRDADHLERARRRPARARCPAGGPCPESTSGIAADFTARATRTTRLRSDQPEDQGRPCRTDLALRRDRSPAGAMTTIATTPTSASGHEAGPPDHPSSREPVDEHADERRQERVGDVEPQDDLQQVVGRGHVLDVEALLRRRTPIDLPIAPCTTPWPACARNWYRHQHRKRGTEKTANIRSKKPPNDSSGRRSQRSATAERGTGADGDRDDRPSLHRGERSAPDGQGDDARRAGAGRPTSPGSARTDRSSFAARTTAPARPPGTTSRNARIAITSSVCNGFASGPGWFSSAAIVSFATVFACATTAGRRRPQARLLARRRRRDRSRRRVAMRVVEPLLLELGRARRLAVAQAAVVLAHHEHGGRRGIRRSGARCTSPKWLSAARS